MKIAFLFPGQGAQFVGMGKDFAEKYVCARYLFEEANDILNRNLSRILWNGSDAELTETKNSQVGIYVTSMALLKVLNELFPHLQPTYTAGLSLGEYSALTAAQKLPFKETLQLVDKRGQFMNEACEETRGQMAVVMGMDAMAVEEMVREINLPQDLWAANFNCPGQVVISGTAHGIELGTKVAKEKGAKRVVPLAVHGAFHSGLMKLAEDKLTPEILQAQVKESSIALVMNYSGKIVQKKDEIQKQLIKQVTSPVRWELGIHTINQEGVDLFLEIGCGKTLSGMNKRIGTLAPTHSIEKIEDLEQLCNY